MLPLPARSPRSRRSRALAALALAVTGVALAVPATGASAAPVATPAAAAAATGGTTYYVDPRGSDGASGTSPSRAWATLARASQQRLEPGDRLLLRRGATHRGTLSIWSSGVPDRRVTVGSFGAGSRPVLTGGRCVVVTGSHVLVEQLYTRSCEWSGFRVDGDHVTVRRSRTTGNVQGINIGYDSEHARIVRNQVVDNDRMAPNTPGPDDDHGAFGIDVNGDRAVIAWNRIVGHDAWSADYGRDGAAVEIYGSTGTVVHHNTSIDNLAFTELGNPTSSDTTYAYNVVRSKLPNAAFIVTRGAGNVWGPIPGTRAVHNTAVLTGRGSQAFWCGGVCGPNVLSLSHNVLVSQARIGYAVTATGAAVRLGGGGNIFWGSGVEHVLSPGDRVVNPGLRSSTDLRPTRSSVLVDRAGTVVAWRRDGSGSRLPVDGNRDGKRVADTGALEVQR